MSSKKWDVPQVFLDIYDKKSKELQSQRELLEKAINNIEESENKEKQYQEENAQKRSDGEKKKQNTDQAYLECQRIENEVDGIRKNVEEEEKKEGIKLIKRIPADKSTEELEAARDDLSAAKNRLKALDWKDLQTLSDPPAAIASIVDSAWILTLDKRGTWDFLQKAMNKRKTDSLIGIDVMSMKDLLMFEAKVIFEDAKATIKQSSIKLSDAAEMLYQWESAVFRVFDEARRILNTNSPSQLKKVELYNVMVTLNKQRKIYEGFKAERDAFNKYRNSLESRCSLLSELRELFVTEQDYWKGLNEWRTVLESTIKKQESLLSDSLFAAGVLTYFGPFSYFSRRRLRDQWIKVHREIGFVAQDEPKVSEILGEPQQLAEWHEKNLLQDATSIENVFILNHSRKWPLIIDPENVASKWMGTKNDIKDINKYYKDELAKKMTQAVFVTLHISTEELDEDIMALIELEKVRPEPFQMMLPSEKARLEASPDPRKADIHPLDVHPKFEFVLFIEHSNPIFSDDIFKCINIINFALPPTALQDQFLIEYGMNLGASEYAKVVLKTEHKLAWDCRGLEKNILKEVNDVVLDSIDSEAQRALKDKIQVTMKNIEDTRKRISDSNEESLKENLDKVDAVTPLASRAAMLYQCMSTLTNVNPTYLYTFKLMRKLYVDLVRSNSEKITITLQQGIPDLKRLMVTFAKTLTDSVMVELEQSMFRSDFLQFALYLTANLAIQENTFKEEEWMVFLYGSKYYKVKTVTNEVKNPIEDIIKPEIWNVLAYLEKAIPASYGGISESVSENTDEWRKWISSQTPHTSPLPKELDKKKLITLQRLLLIRLLSPLNLLECQEWAASSVLGDEYLHIKHPVMAKLFKDETKINRPLLLVKDNNSDPDFNVMALKQPEIPFVVFNLTQENYSLAKKMIEECKKNFDKVDSQWFYVSNIHLFPDFGRFMVEKLKDVTSSVSDQNTAADLSERWLRIILQGSSYRLPRDLLINSVRLSVEAPVSMKQKMIGNLTAFQKQEIDDSEIPANKDKYTNNYRRLMFSLSLLHATLEKRNSFGSKGWTKELVITPGEMQSLSRQLLYFMDFYKEVPLTGSIAGENNRPIEIPWEGLKKMTSEVWIGGPVMEAYDSDILSCYVDKYINEDAAKGDYKVIEADSKFFVPPHKTFEELIAAALNLPITDDLRLCEMNSEATIEVQQNELEEALVAAQMAEQRKNEKEKLSEAKVGEIDKKVLDEIPEHGLLKDDINPIVLETKQGLLAPQYMFLLQEMERYNSMIERIQSIIALINTFTKEKNLMPPALEKIYSDLELGRVPEEFCGYPWDHPLAGWIDELKKRIEYIREWLKTGSVKAYWLKAFINPKGLFDALLISFSQQYKIGVNSLSFTTTTTSYKNVSEITEIEPNKLYIYGLHMVNAKINKETNIIDDLTNEDIEEKAPLKCAKMPIVLLMPTDDRVEREDNFSCPLYFLPKRISKIGSTQNYLMKVDCLTLQNKNHWIMKEAFMTCIDPVTNN